MNPYKIYQQNRDNGQTRIDSVLALYEQANQRLEKALICLENKDHAAAQRTAAPVHLILTALASGIDDKAGEMGISLLKLFEFAAFCLQTPDKNSFQAALDVLRTLHEAFAAIRPEAVQLERSGAIVPLDKLRVLMASA